MTGTELIMERTTEIARSLSLPDGRKSAARLVPAIACRFVTTLAAVRAVYSVSRNVRHFWAAFMAVFFTLCLMFDVERTARRRL